MKITDIECIPVQAPGRTLVPVLVHTDEGISGVGEGGLQRRWKAIQGAIEHMKRWLIGQDPMRIEYLWQRMFRGGFYPADRLIGSAIAAIDIALWDIKGKALGVPVYQLLGGRCRDYVQCFLSPTYRSNKTEPNRDEVDMFRRALGGSVEDSCEAMVKLAKECIADGHKYFRIGPASDGNIFRSRASIRRLIAQLRAVRQAVGDQIELMVDIHARFTPDEAAWFLREVEPLGMFVVEDPVRAEHMHAYRNIRQLSAVPIAAGEQWANKWEFRQVIEEELVDYVRTDLCICGGLTEAKKIAAMAETHFIRVLPHNPLGPVCTAASLHLNLACDNAGPQEIIHPPAQMLPDVFECAFELQGTRLTVPTAPGIGVTFHREAALKYPAEMTEPPHLHREDGSFTNC
ncbi:mandelate racemase/muconate lactonizing enzyme family protein [Fontivita pretiosa]|uniref:mandelate racemase/muconate lactonizing enzyme family protein n=1 Tax=Fontivita pretiosa TaxID=2989684 RepID=UPI003D183319